MKKVLVLFLSYFRKEYTEKALKALLDSYDNYPFDLIIYDNGSRDGTIDFYSKLNHPSIISRILNYENQGVDKPISYLFSQNNYDYYSKIDNDTIVPKTWLSILINESEKFNADIVGARHNTSSTAKQKMIEAVQRKDYTETSHVGGTAFVAKRHLIDKYGNLRSSGFMFGWTAYQIKALRMGARITFSPSLKVQLLDVDEQGEKTGQFKLYNGFIDKLRHGRIIEYKGENGQDR